MLGFDSEAFFESHAGEGFEILTSNFDASSRSLIMVYNGPRIITSAEQVVLKISNFKNPVNQDLKIGFRITGQDSQGYLVDQSQPNLSLKTPMTITGSLLGKEVLMLGDSNGANIGRVFEYNKISFFISSYIPFEQYCYFKFVFPAKLVLDSALQILIGEGIFAPTSEFDSQILPRDFFKVDL
jgi:hypothetical protein